MTPSKPKLSLRSIADLIAAVPYLLGFHPAESVVVVAFRDRRLIFVARVDLPPAGTAPTLQRAAAGHLASVVAKQDADTATVIGYGPAQRVTPAVEAVDVALDRAGLTVVDVLRVNEGRYWSYTCGDPRCCPPDGTPYDPTVTEIAAAATYAGRVALPDRAALARQVAPIGGAAREAMRRATERARRRLDALLATAPATDPRGQRALRKAGAVAIREAIQRHRAGGRLSDDEVAWLGLLLTHIPVRDDAWERIGPDDWQISLWVDLVRRVEPRLAAAPASLLAFAAWRCGQGALASVALERARQVAPGYPMAVLMDEVLRNGIPPWQLGGWPGPAERPRRRSGRQPRRRAPRGRTDKVLLGEGDDHDRGPGPHPA